jgi:isopenicillin-N N-acyltransferase like protein
VTTTPFPFVQLEGAPRDVGLGHGQALGDRIQAGLDHYREMFAERSGIDWPSALDLASRIIDPIRGYAPDLMEELEGIADGSEHPLEAIVALNARTAVMAMARRPVAPECTMTAVLPSRTKDGHTILGGNWDQHVRCIDISAVMEIHMSGRPAIMVHSEAGTLVRTGFNSAGIGVTGNSLACDRDGVEFSGIPTSVMRRRVLQHESLAPALREAYAAPRNHSNNHLVASAEGFAVDLEATPGEIFAVTPEDDLIVHSNHFVSAAACARVEDRLVGRSPSTLYRKERLEAALADVPEIDVPTIQAALRDHFGHPDSVCNHPSPDRPTGTTAASHIADLDTKTLWITTGPPCENPYLEYRLS